MRYTYTTCMLAHGVGWGEPSRVGSVVGLHVRDTGDADGGEDDGDDGEDLLHGFLLCGWFLHYNPCNFCEHLHHVYVGTWCKV